MKQLGISILFVVFGIGAGFFSFAANEGKTKDLAPSPPPEQAQNFESLFRQSHPIRELRELLLPFVKPCSDEKDYFKRLFCSGLNDRLVVQHQTRAFRAMFGASPAGPLMAQFIEKPSPALELTVRGCLTCKEPFYGHFFFLKTPQDIRPKGGAIPFDFGDITLATYTAPLPKDMT